MNKQILLSILLFSVIYASCKKERQNYETIKVNLSENKEVTVNIKTAIPLETTDSSMFGEVTRISYLNHRFYLLDNEYSRSIFVFDETGKYLKKTLKGKGPAELLWPHSYSIDTLSKTISIFDLDMLIMKEFDYDLNYLKTKPTIDIGFNNFEKIGEDWLLYVNNVNPKNKQNNTQNYSYLIYSNDFSKCLKEILPLSSEMRSIIAESSISRENTQKIFSTPFNHNLYSIMNNDLHVIYSLDYGKYNITESDINQGPGYVFKLVREGKRITNSDHLVNNDQYLGFNFYFQKGFNYNIHSKKTKNNYYSGSFVDKGDLPRGILHGILNQDTFILMVTAEDYLEFCKKTNRADLKNFRIKPSDNEVIVLFTLTE